MGQKAEILFWRKVFIAAVCAFGLFSLKEVRAEDIVATHVKLRALDKVTGRFRTLEGPLGEEIGFENLKIYPDICLKKPPEETPEDMAFLSVYEKKPQGEEELVFKGWMFSSNPALSPMEHPIYDVWVLECFVSQEEAARLQNPPMAELERSPSEKERGIPSAFSDSNEQGKRVAGSQEDIRLGAKTNGSEQAVPVPGDKNRGAFIGSEDFSEPGVFDGARGQATDEVSFGSQLLNSSSGEENGDEVSSRPSSVQDDFPLEDTEGFSLSGDGLADEEGYPSIFPEEVIIQSLPEPPLN